MTVTFLSRPLDRHVESTTSAQPVNYVEPKKRFYASPDVAAGQVVADDGRRAAAST